MAEPSSLHRRVDPGRLVKIVGVRQDGMLIPRWAPVGYGRPWQSPVLRAHDFDPGTTVQQSAGVHAFRFGMKAYPRHPHLAVLICRVLPGTCAVMSPWAVRAEALLVEEVRLHPKVGRRRLQVIREQWGPHCPVVLSEPPADKWELEATGDCGFSLWSPVAYGWCSAGHIHLTSARMQPVAWRFIAHLMRSIENQMVISAAVKTQRCERQWIYPERPVGWWRAAFRWASQVHPVLDDILRPWRQFLAMQYLNSG